MPSIGCLATLFGAYLVIGCSITTQQSVLVQALASHRPAGREVSPSCGWQETLAGGVAKEDGREQHPVLSFIEQLLHKNQPTVYSREEIRQRVQQEHAADCADSAQSGLAVEKDTDELSHVPPCSTIHWQDVRTTTTTTTAAAAAAAADNYRLACQSTAPLLTTSELTTIRQAVDAHWKGDTASSSSRFTFQRAGNSEAHVAELGADVCRVVNNMLVQHVYPMIRRRFINEMGTDNDCSSDDKAQLRLCVYDALIIRYNATATDGLGAGQPLHRDLGLVSINVLLSDKSDFEGGGTFMENQLRDKVVPPPLQPPGAGYALAHASGERHAGAATQHGVREIMVIFVTANPPPGTLLKACRDVCAHRPDPWQSLYCRLQHLRMAVEMQPRDGEAWQYLANALLEYYDATEGDTAMLHQVRHALQEAGRWTPCDARVYHTLARCLDRLRNHQQQQQQQHQYTTIPSLATPVTLPQVEAAYQRSLDLLQASQRQGCQVTAAEEDALRLNYGLHLANRDLFEGACAVLAPVVGRNGVDVPPVNRVVDDARRLYQFCASRQ